MEMGKENIGIANLFWDHIRDKKWDEARNLLADNFEAVWPQSREKMNANGFIEVNRNYPGVHEIQQIDTNHEYDKWEHRSKVITQTHVKSEMPDGKKLEFYAISFFEIEEEKILSIVEYWAEAHTAPDWRKQWVERF